MRTAPHRAPWWGALLLAGAALSGCLPAPETPVYLTLPREDATRAVAVHWHSQAAGDRARVHYDVVPRGGRLDAYARSATGSVRRREAYPASVRVVELGGLEPDSVYFFALDDGGPATGREYSFRTPPAEGPMTFVTGGDMGTGLLTRMVSRRAAEQSPAFALIGGDLAYAHGRPEHADRWRRWFADWSSSMRTPEGHLVPLVFAPGNHDLDLAVPIGAPPRERAPWLTFFFYQDEGESSFFLRRFGAQLALWVLDTGHLAPMEAQTRWLAQSLREQADVRFRFALYHIALYPAHHPFDHPKSRRGRELWVPLFDAARLAAAFESHDHLYKRTHPLRGGRIVPVDAGTLYLGGGCWGKGNPEQPDLERGYLAAAGARRHVWRVRVEGDAVEYVALGAAGQVLDRVVQTLGDEKAASAEGVGVRSLE